MIEIFCILVLLLANGVFAMTEIAVVSSRRGKLKAYIKEGRRGARKALHLTEHPSRFLSTVQIGITLVGLVTGAFAGSSIARQITPWLEPLLGQYAWGVSMGVIFAVLTYLQIVIGELVPKRLAMIHPETLSMKMAGMMSGLSTVAAPAVWLLNWSTERILALLGASSTEESRVSKEELTVLIQEGTSAGTVLRAESDLVERVFDLAQVTVEGIMTPRLQMVWLQENDAHEAVWHKIVTSYHHFFPVYRKERDSIVGYVSVKALYCQLAAGIPVRLPDIMRPPLIVPEHQSALNLLETFKQTRVHVAFVVDEFGGVVGMVTLSDLLEAIVGDMPSREERQQQAIQTREDGSRLIDAMIEVEKVAEALEGFPEPEGAGEEFHTLAGFLIDRLQRVPQEGDSIEHASWRLEVIDMDGHRVDKVLAQRITPAPQATPEGGAAEDEGGHLS